MEPHARDKAQFYLKQVSAALAPSNFIGTNPELLRATLAESGENLVRGLKMLTEDIEAGKGKIRIRQVDARSFQLGVNMANTPGKVIYRNDLIELIQYEPTTPDVFKRPLLIVPPWINKFYILDLNPEKSFVRWAVSQGLTVFVVSWVNPDARLGNKSFEDYMREGVLDALGKIEEATGERKVSAIGYCVGGTLLAATLGYMAAVGDDRIESATFFTTQIDFTDPGDLKVFVDAEQLKMVEERMAEQGYLEGAAMAQAFNMLRPNDLIWSYYVNNYLKGKEPMPFDLLVWNSDSTRMPAANHKFYLRHCYFQNDLANGRMALGGKTLEMKKVTIPVYELAAKEDHIAPARSAFIGAKTLGGPVRFVMAGSGHIAGVVNPPSKPKYQYWSGGPVEGNFEDWVQKAKETPGSWWPDWVQWVAAQAPEKVPARTPGSGKLKPIGDAPGEYVRVKS
jgi:polyhydroxyalkanoate synthase